MIYVLRKGTNNLLACKNIFPMLVAFMDDYAGLKISKLLSS